MTVMGAGSASAVGVVIALPSLRSGVLSAYPGDSLFTLEPLEIAGLVAISAAISLAGFVLAVEKSVWLSRRTPPGLVPRLCTAAADIVVTAILFTVCYSLLPQLFYQFYRLIIPGLPNQWVVRAWIDLPRLWSALSMASSGRLAELAAGLVFWTLVLTTLWFHAVEYRFKSLI